MRPINQRGIVIGPILFIVAILAVTAAAIAAGSGEFNGDISAVSAKAQASAILEYANEVKFAVDRVLAKGCTDTQISFENPIVSGYENPNAPSDKSCHVFDVNGGGIVWKNPPQEIFFDNNYGQWLFLTGTVGVKSFRQLGTQEHELFLGLIGSIAHSPNVNAKGKVLLNVCQEINKMLGVESGSGVGGLPATPSTGPYHIAFPGFFNPAAGSYDTGPLYVPEPAMWGKTTLCIQRPTNNFMFMEVLILR